MIQALEHFHFLQPEWLLGLFVLPVSLWFGARNDAGQRALSKLADAELLPYLLTGKAKSARGAAGLFALGWTLCVLALAGPTWSRIAEPMYANRPAQVVALSLSQHMLATDVPPSRIERARYKARDLLAANRDGLNALIGYAGQSFVVAPLTSDAHSLDDLLNAMAPDTMPVDGDNAAQAIQQGVELIHNAKVDNGSIVLITDDADDAAQAAARQALASGIRVSVLGIGTTQGAPVPGADSGFAHDNQGNMVLARRNDDALQKLAHAGGGRYVAMSEDGSDTVALHAELQRPQHATLAQGQEGDAWQDRGPWLLLPLLLVAAMAFRRGWLLLLPFVFLPLLPNTAQASGWKDWWQRPDQQAASALRRGDAATAMQLAQDPALRGAAAYRAKDYAAAVQAWQQAKGPNVPYNLGNAFAKLGRYPEAIKAYDHALQLNPNNGDARINRKIVEDAMRKPPPKPSPQQQQKSGSGQSQQKGQHDTSGQSSGQSQNDQNKSQSSGQSRQQQNNPQQGQTGQDQNGQPQGAQPQHESQASQGDHASKANDAQQQDAGKDSAPSTTGQTPAPTSSTERAQSTKAQQGLQQQMNQALAQAQQKSSKEPPSHELGAVDSDDPLSKLPIDVRRDLERVPDDPGALLRRKFQLEYRERMGAQPSQGDQP